MMFAFLRRCRYLTGALTMTTLVACGGGGGGGGAAGFSPPVSNPPPPTVDPYTPGVFEPSEDFRYLCETPPGTSPGVQGTTTDENNWLRSWSNELYLWYDEIVDRNPANYETPDYFELQKTERLTASGAPKDKFHFSIPTEEWIALSQSGESAGYGSEFALLSAAPPREIVVAFTYPGTPAAAAGLVRGTEIIAINGEDVATSNDVELLNAALFPAGAGETYSFTVLDPGASATRIVALTSQIITSDPVNVVDVIDTLSGPVGYISFTEHIATSEVALVQAINQLGSAAVTDLVLDVRYNGGGFLDIANELAFMIAGPGAASGRVFDEIQFNDKYPFRNPVTNEVLEPDYFHTTTQGFSISAGQPLPSLNLNRVYVLTGPGTCSASETIINGLRGIDIEVIQIGDTTCGKPYGFYAFDNCGISYFSIQFRGINAMGFGDYTDGFSPENVSPAEGVPVPGCDVADDFDHALGDPEESRLKAALEYRETGTCPLQPLVNTGVLSIRKTPVNSTEAVARPRRPGMVKLR